MFTMINIIQASVMPQRQSSNEQFMYILWYVTSCGLVDLNIVSPFSGSKKKVEQASSKWRAGSTLLFNREDRNIMSL
jgi:hypothetical protein